MLFKKDKVALLILLLVFEIFKKAIFVSQAKKRENRTESHFWMKK